MKALAPRKEDRFAGADQMQGALQPLVSSRSAHTRRRIVTWSLVSATLPLMSFAIARWGTLPATPDAAAAAAPMVVAASAPNSAPTPPEVAPVSEARPAPVAVAPEPPETAPEPVPSHDEPVASLPARDDAELTSKLALARSLMKRGAGQRQRSLELMRELADSHPDDPDVLAQWSRSAASVQWWGESLRAAIRWAAIDPGEASHLHLARTQRLVGQRFGAIQTLERFLSRQPESKSALLALEQYRRGR